MRQLESPVANIPSIQTLARTLVIGCALATAAACGTPVDVALTDEGAGTFSVESGSREEIALLALANDESVDVALLDVDVALDARAARNIVAARPFATVDELDAVSYVGPTALNRMLAFALANGYAPGEDGTGEDGVSEEVEILAMLAFVNDAATSEELLDDDVGLDARAARNIVAHRDGADAVVGTEDDDLFDDVAELDAVSYVGQSALGRLRAYAAAHGWIDVVIDTRDDNAQVDVIFSPQAIDQSHTARVKHMIATAEVSLDVAMYSLSDTSLITALEQAVDRGVTVRMVFEGANKDRKKTGADFERSKSARLERAGVDVRYVNKIMHHKYVIVDGPKDNLVAAATARISSGSGNWSSSAATRYDENTLFFEGEPAVALLLQQEFDYMWSHSRDFDAGLGLDHPTGEFVIDAQTLADVGVNDDDADLPLDIYFTSENFSINEGSTTFRRGDRSVVADALVAAIEDATESIWVASGHLRSRPVSEALMAKVQDAPEVEIKVLLDGQEYISSYYQGVQLRDLADCLSEASTATQERNCNESGFLFGYSIGEAGVDVRYSYSAYRWHYSYAQQMHHKLLIIDSDELWTGSYNLSANAEFSTFENMMVLRGARFQDVIDAYEENFVSLWDRNRDGAYADLMGEVEAADQEGPGASFPIVFEAMTLTYDEVTDFKSLVRDVCPAINSDDYRRRPEAHRYCNL